MKIHVKLWIWIDPEIKDIFTKYRKTHNQGVFDVYTPEMRAARKSGIITGLPDAYGRGRIRQTTEELLYTVLML